MKYDESVIEEQARRLYKRADSLALSTAIRYAIIFAFVGMFAEILITQGNPIFITAPVAALIGFSMGHSNGREKGFSLRLSAQTALCQVQIEKNTRSKEVPTA